MYNSRDEELIAMYHRARALTKSLGELGSHQADEKTVCSANCSAPGARRAGSKRRSGATTGNMSASARTVLSTSMRCSSTAIPSPSATTR
ncbi:hypothetical protein M5585_05570 [Serratia ureilytica]